MDLVLTDENERIIEESVLPAEHLSFSSDHFLVKMFINTSAIHSPSVMPKYVFDYPNTDFQGMHSYLLVSMTLHSRVW